MKVGDDIMIKNPRCDLNFIHRKVQRKWGRLVVRVDGGYYEVDKKHVQPFSNLIYYTVK